MSTRLRRKRGRGTKARRVLLQPAGGIDGFGRRNESASQPTSRHLKADAYNLRTHPIVRLTSNGIDWGAWPGQNDEVGYGMHPYRQDDCLQAAIATCTQVPIEQVPDLELDRRFVRGEDRKEISRTSWERIDRWADKRGLQLGLSDAVPLPLERWIGVIVRPVAARKFNEHPEAVREARQKDGLLPFQDHCLVMSHDRIVFDPACSVRLPPGAERLLMYDPADITYGITFTRKET